MTRVACRQCDVRLGDFEANVKAAIEAVHEAGATSIDILVMPECALTGYAVRSKADAERIAVEAERLAPLAEACDAAGVTAVVGFAERDGDRLFNSAALLEPGAEARVYRKTHLPELGYDKFVSPGDRLPVFDTRHGRIGVLVCFDLRHPEATRVLALEGADLIVLPTNWPEGAYAGPQFVAAARAAENKVWFATCNRVGTEFRFIGQSGLYDPGGNALARAGEGDETIVAEMDLPKARDKRNVIVPGEYEITMDVSRRPELYGPIVRR
jgi:5-aminopentanamidase